jgi:hypothetical protein
MRSISDLFGNFMQLGYVTDDIEAAVAYFEITFGTVSCLKAYNRSQGGIVVVDGEVADEWVVDAALVNAGTTNLELIRPVSGAVDLYRSAIRPGVPASLHHLAFRVDDIDEATAVLESNGKSWKQFGNLEGFLRFGYFDMTAELGHYVEILQLEQRGIDYFAAIEAASNK